MDVVGNGKILSPCVVRCANLLKDMRLVPNDAKSAMRGTERSAKSSLAFELSLEERGGELGQLEIEMEKDDVV